MGLLARVGSLAHVVALVAAQQCYFGPGAANRGPSELVPCQSDGESACCLLGDICYAGGVCWDNDTGNLYQYGCTDINYQDASCPFKCGWNETKSAWTALEYCQDNTWTCQSPESCGCEWNSSWALLDLAPRGCQAMGYEARVALFGPQSLAPYLSLPSTAGGTTAYFSTYMYDGTLTWDTTAVSGYTPSSIGPYTSYSVPNTIVEIFPNQTPSPATLPAAVPPGATASTPTNPVTTPSISQIPSTSSASSASSASSTSSSSPSSSSALITTSGSSSVSRTSSAASTSSNLPTTTTTSSSSGLSSGAKVGIGVGVGVGVGIFASVLAIFFFLWNRKRKAQKAKDSDSDHATNGLGGSGKDSKSPQRDEKHGSWQKHNRGPSGGPEWGFDPNAEYVGAPALIHEAPTGGQPPEMSTLPQTPPAELDAGMPLYELSSESREPSTSASTAAREAHPSGETGSQPPTTTAQHLGVPGAE